MVDEYRMNINASVGDASQRLRVLLKTVAVFALSVFIIIWTYFQQGRLSARRVLS